MKESQEFADQAESPNAQKKTPTSHKIYAKLPQEDSNFFSLLRRKTFNPKHSMLEWLDSTCQSHNILWNSEVNAVLIDLMMYKSPELISTSFNLLHHNFSHKRALVDYLKDIQIIEDEQKMKVLKEAVHIKKELQLMVDECENWWGQKKQEAFTKSQKMADYITKLIKMLFWSECIRIIFYHLERIESQEVEMEQSGGNDLSQLMKEVDNLISNNDRESIDKILDSSCIEADEIAKVIKPDFQKLLRNIQVHKVVIQLIEFDQGSSYEENTNRVKVLQKCYKLLAFYCFDNQTNRELLMEYVEIFQAHLRSCKDALSYLVLSEVFRNNRSILLDNQKLKKTLAGVCSIMKGLEFDDKLRVYLLESLQIYMKIDDSVIKGNQTLMLTHLGADPKNLLYVLDDEDEMDEFLEQCQGMSEKLDNYLSNYDLDQQMVDFMNDEMEMINVPFKIDFFVCQMSLLSLATAEENAATESKCAKFFPLEKMLKLLKGTQHNWVVRKEIFFLFYNVYLEIELEMDENFEFLIPLLWELANDFKYIAKEWHQLFSSKVSVQFVQRSVTAKKLMQEYLTTSIIPCLTEIVKLNFVPEREVKAYFTQVVESIFKISQCQSQSVTYSVAKLLLRIQKSRSVSAEINFPGIFKARVPQILSSMITKIIQQGPKMSNYYKIKFTARKFVKGLTNEDQDSLNYKFQKRLDEMVQCSAFTGKKEEEFLELVTFMVNIERNTKIFKNTVIKFDEVFLRLLEMADPIDDPLPRNLQITSLIMFRKIIERENQSQNISPSAEWDFPDYEKSLARIVTAQNLVLSLGFKQYLIISLVECLCNLISLEEIDIESKHQAVLCSIALLLGGNIQAQDKFYGFLQNDNSNMLIITLKNLIEANLLIVKKALDRRNKAITSNLSSVLPQVDSGKPTSHQDQTIYSPDPTFRPGALAKLQQPTRTPESEYQQVSVVDSLQAFEKEAFVNLKRLFRLLQLFCEGHNLNLQDFLREQRQGESNVLNGKSVNFVGFCCEVFGIITRSLNQESVDLASQIIDFLIECVQGPCPANQTALVNHKVVYFCRDLLQMFVKDLDYFLRGFDTEELREKANNLVLKSTKLLVSLLEANDTIDIIKMLSENLEMSFIKKKLGEAYQSLLKELNLEENAKISTVLDALNGCYSQNVEEAFSMYILLVTLNDGLKPTKLKNPAKEIINAEMSDDIESRALNFFKQNTLSVEIFFKFRLVRVFFPIQPACRKLSKVTRREFMTNVKRDSPNDKLSGLLAESKVLFIEMDHLSFLASQPIQFTSKQLMIILDICTLLSFTLNGLLMYALDRKLVRNNTKIVMVTDTIDWINALGILQLTFVIIMIIVWLIINAPIIIKAAWTRFNRENRQMISSQMENELLLSEGRVEEIDIKLIKYVLETKGPFCNLFQNDNINKYGSFYGYMLYSLKSMIFLLSHQQFAYLLSYLLNAIIGLVISEIFYSFHLLDIIRRFEMLQNVIKSVTQNIKQLMLTMLLMLLIIFIYSLVIYNFLNNNLVQQDENLCASVLYCFISTFKFGITAGGGIGEILRDISYESDYRQTFWVRSVLDISFFAIIIVMFLNIIFGIIIDTFAALRDEKNRMQEDMKSKCFICGLDRYVFEKNADGFKMHIERDHQMWNYLYYLYYISKKDQTELNGIESYVMEKYVDLNNEWFPMMKAMSLKHFHEEQDSSQVDLSRMKDYLKQLEEEAADGVKE